MPKKTANFLSTRTGYIVTGLVALVLAYAMGSRAIDTGSLGQYALTFTLLLVAINRLALGALNKV